MKDHLSFKTTPFLRTRGWSLSRGTTKGELIVKENGQLIVRGTGQL